MAFFVPPAQAVIHKVSIRSIIIFIISLTAYSHHYGIINQNHFFMIIITQCTNHIFFIFYATGTKPSLPVLDPHRAGNIYIKEFDGDDGYSSKIYDEPVIFLCLKKDTKFNSVIKGPEHWTSGVGSQHSFAPSSSPWSQSVIVMMMTIKIMITIMLIKHRNH